MFPWDKALLVVFVTESTDAKQQVLHYLGLQLTLWNQMSNLFYSTTHFL